jgi:hypothetical protein
MADYFQVLQKRIGEACRLLAETDPTGLLAIVVDAADNAVLAARDAGSSSFVVGLLRESFPANCRLVVSCRTERLELLQAPPTTEFFELKSFTLRDTTTYLEAHFESVCAADISEFHRVTGGHPRAQAAALAGATDVHDVLRALGPDLKSSELIIDSALEAAIATAKDAHGGAPRDVDRMCEALAVLRPMIPIDVLASVAEVSTHVVASFVSDLARPLLIDQGAVQFRDEPTETWFHTKFRLSDERIDGFLERVTALAPSNAYLATSLPDLLLQAGRVRELTELALNRTREAGRIANPYQTEDLERYEISLRTVHLALKGCLRHGMNLDAARLALRAGNLSAGHTRRLELICKNPDLASLFLDPTLLEHLVATRSLTRDWPGSNLVVEAAVLSTADGQRDLARNRVRIATDWATAWVRQRKPSSTEGSVEVEDIADLAWGILNTDSPAACANYLARWRPTTIAFDAGLVLCRRLADFDRFDELNQLAGLKLKWLQLAAAQASWESNVEPSELSVRRIVQMLRRHRSAIEISGDRSGLTNDIAGLDGIIWVLALGVRAEELTPDHAVRILDYYLPQRIQSSPGSWYRPKVESLLRGYALRARLLGHPLDPDTIAGADVERARKKKSREDSRAVREHKANVVPLCRWLDLWASYAIGSDPNLASDYERLAEESFRGWPQSDPPRLFINAFPRVAVRLLARIPSGNAIRQIVEWCQASAGHLSWPTLTELARVAAGQHATHDVYLSIARLLRESIDSAREEDSSTLCDSLVGLARSSYRFGEGECRSHFERAVEITERGSDDLYTRWRTLNSLAEIAIGEGESPSRAYRLAQIAEAIRPYMQEALDVGDCLAKVTQFSPSYGLAIASRWRDRRVASVSQIAASLTSANSVLKRWPMLALSMVSFDDDAPFGHLLGLALQERPERGREIAQAVGELKRAEPQSEAFYRRLDQVAAASGVDLRRTGFDPDIRVTRRELQAASPQTRDNWLTRPLPRDRLRAKEKALAHLKLFDFTTPEGWDSALMFVHERDVPASAGEVIKTALSGPTADLANIVNAFARATQIDSFDCKELVSHLILVPERPYAIRGAVSGLCDVVIERFSNHIVGLEYDRIGIKAMAELSGRTSESIVAGALRRLGSTQTPLTSGECYSLARVLAQQAPSVDAGVIFDECTDLYLEMCPVDSSDGLFHELPDTPDEVPAAAMGFLWTALGDTAGDVRWRAAHSVRLLLESSAHEEIFELAKFASEPERSAGFTDRRVVFYQKHARQWLLFALSAAAQIPVGLGQVQQFAPLIKSVLAGPPHVVMQQNARQAILPLVDAGLTELTEDERCTVENLDPAARRQKVMPEPEHKRRALKFADLIGRGPNDSPLADKIVEFESEDDLLAFVGEADFHFFMDFRDYWCERLGDAFGLHRDAVEQLVSQLVIEEWRLPYRGKSAEDQRYTLHFYGESSSTYKSDWPADEDLSFYLGVHALYEIAGRLLDALPIVRGPYGDEDEYSQFLVHHLLSRKDGRWLSDRRDAGPQVQDLGEAERDDETKLDPWVYSIGRADFDRYLEPEPGWLTVHGQFNEVSGSRSRDTYAKSAFVHEVATEALLRAIRRASSATPVTFPDAGERTSMGSGVFALKGWIDDVGSNFGRDGQDPFARGVSYPPPHPSDFVVRAGRLESDANMRTWTRDGQQVILSTVWDDVRQGGRNERAGSSGDELRIKSDFLQDLLVAEGFSLLVAVTIHPYSHRPHNYVRGERYDENGDPTYIESSTMYYVIDRDGTRREI